jgi:DNA-directed RNA polymerase subunit RPC12/RpoP
MMTEFTSIHERLEQVSWAQWKREEGIERAHKHKRKNAIFCQYCGFEAVFVDSSEVYGKSYGMIYLCRRCGAYVGVHKGTKKPKGILANAELREWKKRAHAAFDPHWMGHHRGQRDAAYAALARVMGKSKRDCHIGEFDVEDCRKVMEACEYGLIVDMMKE